MGACTNLGKASLRAILGQAFPFPGICSSPLGVTALLRYGRARRVRGAGNRRRGAEVERTPALGGCRRAARRRARGTRPRRRRTPLQVDRDLRHALIPDRFREGATREIGLSHALSCAPATVGLGAGDRSSLEPWTSPGSCCGSSLLRRGLPLALPGLLRIRLEGAQHVPPGLQELLEMSQRVSRKPPALETHGATETHGTQLREEARHVERLDRDPGSAKISSMSKVESLLANVRSLTNAERQELAQLLLERTALESASDEEAAGLRGLRAWTASAETGEWSPYYPESLRNPRSPEP
jgi:hypothetical protein